MGASCRTLGLGQRLQCKTAVILEQPGFHQAVALQHLARLGAQAHGHRQLGHGLQRGARHLGLVGVVAKYLGLPAAVVVQPYAQHDHGAQQRLYEAVTDYVRHGYNQALAAKQRHIGFLMILMQRLVTSSTAAIRTTLEKRQALLEAPQPQANLFENTSADEWADLDGQSQVDLAMQSSGWELEKSEVEMLLELARVSNLPTVWSNVLAAWLVSGAGLSAGMVLVRDQDDLTRAFTQEAPYLFSSGSDAQIWDMGPRSFQCSRRADVLKLWVAIERYGSDNLARLYDRLCRMAWIPVCRDVAAHFCVYCRSVVACAQGLSDLGWSKLVLGSSGHVDCRYPGGSSGFSRFDGAESAYRRQACPMALAAAQRAARVVAGFAACCFCSRRAGAGNSNRS